MEAALLKYRLLLAGHVPRIEDQYCRMTALYGELSTGHAERGTLRKDYKDCLEKSFTACHADHLLVGWFIQQTYTGFQLVAVSQDLLYCLTKLLTFGKQDIILRNLLIDNKMLILY